MKPNAALTLVGFLCMSCSPSTTYSNHSPSIKNLDRVYLMRENFSKLDKYFQSAGFKESADATKSCEPLIKYYKERALTDGKVFIGFKSYTYSGDQVKVMESIISSLISLKYDISGWSDLKADRPKGIYVYYKFKEPGISNSSGLFPLEYKDYLHINLSPVENSFFTACLITTGVK
ncbi:hypothetical protein [Deinococcus sp. RIT780]|uniref:hypothetical protein n=1 Tax=Deinococcus sp. RIT780 TaxID=2870472 RepID=UPI001C891E09|nr:hypothetical protein [Deinococcus sp. RIT780]MBX8463939.1 hypothetical protein [Deinococcus sp. RIT780]